jgi:hypothetical protein
MTWTSTDIFTLDIQEALFIISKRKKQPKSPLIDEWKKFDICVYIIEILFRLKQKF